jgi:hypothetical protein
MRIRPGYSAVSAVADYRRWISGNASPVPGVKAAPPPTISDIRIHLKGKNLACWCALEAPCHADVLLELANST